VILVFFVVVPAMIVREIVVSIRRQIHRADNQGNKTKPNQRHITRLRMLAWIAVAAAVGQHVAHQFGWTHKYTDLLTTALLVLALALTLVARRLTSQQR
jgi:hypothetical protein